MKLISIHVDDFGILHNYDYNFDDGLNVVLHDNGWGKTTMAAFLKAMLYGYDNKRSKDITENERKRYLPWQGGKYGGSLDFEAEGIRYRIYRTFGDTPRYDKVKIVNLDTKTTAKIDPEKIGETLFKLDASAFQRSVFINQNGLSIDGAASSIHTRLNNIVSQANDVAAYDGAIARLTQQTKIYEKAGAKGQIGDITRQITNLEHQRDRLEADISAQDEARVRISQIDVLLNDINEKLADQKKKLDEISGEVKKREASKKLLEDISAQIADLQKKIDDIKEKLGGSIPTANETDAVKRQKQAIDILTVQIEELETSHAKLNADYTALLEKYGDSMPTTTQLDEIQQIYGELQGILSTGNEETTPEKIETEGYEIIAGAAATDADYISKLEITVGSQMTIQQLISKLEACDRNIMRESESWSSKKERYAVLTSDVEQARSDVKAQEQYRPEVIDPVISGLNEVQSKQQRLAQEEASLKNAIQREEDTWAGQKARYSALQADVDALKLSAQTDEKYNTAAVGTAISKLEDIQQRQQIIDVKRESISGTSLTPEQEEILSASPEELPNSTEGNEILKKYRKTAQHQAEIQGLSARLEGEKSKAESLRTSIDQLSLAGGTDSAPVEQPKKPAGNALIAAGAAIAVIGILLIFVLAPFMAAVAVLGAALMILGIVRNNEYKTKLRAYELYKAAESKNQEAMERKAELQNQLKAVQASVSDLEKQISNHRSELESDETEVAQWLSKWAPEGTAASETAIAYVIDNAEEVRKLRKKKQAVSETQSFVESESAKLASERAEVDAQYPEVVGMPTGEALSLLRAADTERKIKEDKLKTALHSLDEFLTEAKIPAETFRAEKSPKIAELRIKLQKVESELAETDKSCKAFCEIYPEIEGLSFNDALDLLRGKQSAYKVSDSRLQTAIRNESKFVADAKITREQLAMPESPNISALTEAENETRSALDQTLKDANEVLKSIGLSINADNAQHVLRQAEQTLNAYKQQLSILNSRAERQQKRQRQIDELQKKLAEKTSVLSGRYAELEMPERLALIRKNISDAAKLKEKAAETERDLKKKKSELENANNIINIFSAKYGKFEPQTDDILSEIYAEAGSYTELTSAMRQLEKQRSSIEAEQSSQTHQVSAEEVSLRNMISALESRKDALLVEYTQKSDFIRQADQSLERYPDVVTEIHQLYDQKQKAQNTLVMLKRTIRLITKAKENLADRYLSKVEQLFNSYMHIWLNNDAIKGILDVDFNIAIEENDKSHVAEAYSTGYSDLIDFCMRLALVDTLFENEQPFLILDDPFVNLDAERLDKALELLNVMAANKQIIYFVCHPIRAVEAGAGSASREKFVQIADATRREIEKRQVSGTGSKKPVRKSLKDLYKVASPGSLPPFKPAKLDYTITNNIFGMNFVINSAVPAKDNSYELFFIDANGRILNDRQLIEIKDGKLSVERVQFCLNSRDDSGNSYELMIRESGQDDYEVIARIPFKAKLAFTGTDSFGF